VISCPLGSKIKTCLDRGACESGKSPIPRDKIRCLYFLALLIAVQVISVLHIVLQVYNHLSCFS
jgi:hypothetical protein